MRTSVGRRGQKRPRPVVASNSFAVVTLFLSVLLVVISNQNVVCLHESATRLSSSEDPSNNHLADEPHGDDSQHPESENQTTQEPSAPISSHKTKQEEGRLWGAATHEEMITSPNNKIPFVAKPGTGTKTTSSTTSTTTSTHQTIYQDPFATGFQINTRVYTDVHDKKAHFDNDFSETIVLPYWECGVTGSTTVPIPLQHVQVRHLLGSAKPSSFSVGGGEDNFGPQPQLVVALTPLEIVLNSGQQQTFVPGDVILLENVIAGGHKLQGVEKSQNMICMLLTLPNAYHYIGKDRNSLQTIFEKTFWKQNPCKTGLAVSNSDGTCGDKRGDGGSDDDIRSSVLSRWSGPPRAMRRVGLGVIGAGLSLAIADFLGKCAPFILAVALGGGVLVVGGTYGVVKLGEYGIDEIEVWNERRLLRLQGGAGSSDDDDDNRRKQQSDDDNELNPPIKRIDASSTLAPETEIIG
ncbi:hypothetical protein IV203_024264 [Nitzschia inconspicua]|uniref:Transmembrane protein n=1 Tax=Nitzschia inconspicua TaxID=303405 RepID=A0A9K3PBH2_9STRA|nr:hypothetical protein IV203_024264 [Nitzschia inconspicua]